MGMDTGTGRIDNCPLSINMSLSLIFERLLRYLAEEGGFLRRDLNRTTLAAQLGTNEKHLARAVRLFSGGETLGQCINHRRMDYACRLMAEHPEYTIDAIIAECGATSRSAFYRMFLRYVGCTPTEYRCIHKIGTTHSP